MTADLGDTFPIQGDQGWLLAAAVRSPHSKSLTELGRAAGMSRSRASRAGRRLVDCGWLRPVGGEYAFNDDRADARLLVELLHLLTGVERPDSVVGESASVVDDYGQDLYWARAALFDRDLPDPFTTRRTMGQLPAPGEVPAVAARLVNRDLGELLVHLSSLNSLAGSAYSARSNERLRDYIHATGWHGYPVRQARQTIREACQAAQPLGEDPQVGAVPAHAWARCIYLLGAEVRMLDETVARFAEAYDVGHKINTLREEVYGHLTRDAVGRQGEMDTTSPYLLNKVVGSDLPKIDELTETAHGRLYWIGGMPSIGDVGGPGDALLEAMACRCADATRRIAQEMIGHEAWQSWRTQHADVLEEHPLPAMAR